MDDGHGLPRLRQEQGTSPGVKKRETSQWSSVLDRALAQMRSLRRSARCCGVSPRHSLAGLPLGLTRDPGEDP